MRCYDSDLSTDSVGCIWMQSRSQPIIVGCDGTRSSRAGCSKACGHTCEIEDRYSPIIVNIRPAKFLVLTRESCRTVAGSPACIVATHVLQEWISVAGLASAVVGLE